MSGRPSPPASGFALAQRCLPLIALGVALVLLVVLFCYLIDVVLLAFAGALLAILLRAPVNWIAQRTRLTEGWALFIVIAGSIALLGGAGWMFGQGLSDQMATLAERLPQLVAQLRDRRADYRWLVRDIGADGSLLGGASTMGRGITVVVATFGAVANVAIVFFTGLFFAMRPALYLDGMLQLVPLPHRHRAAQVARAIGDTLRRWLVGQLFLMIAIGTLTGVGLWMLGVPLAFALALIAGLLEFIPYIGPVISAIPAVLVALAESPHLAGYVLLFYIGVQTVEGYVLQPLVQQRAVRLPPAVLLLAQVVLGILVGALGVMLATPLTATVLVMMQMWYVHDVLGEPSERTTASGKN